MTSERQNLAAALHACPDGSMRNFIKAGLVALVLSAPLALPATAGLIADRLAAAESGNYATALRRWKPLADQGDAKAQNNFGVMYANGFGVPQEDAEAAAWYRRAAEQGNAKAQVNLGLMYVNGWGVPQDFVLAHKWLNLAASRYSASEKESRDRAVTNRDLVAAKMTPAQIAEAQKLAREWKPK